jgi:predicted Rossmann fold nucleotide-binding protein DprA/Smf involved in DNA uptake
MMSFEEQAYVALFADWQGRRSATSSPRAVRALPQSFTSEEAILRLRAVGHAQAAALLEDHEVLEGAQALITRRAFQGWKPVLHHDLPLRMREVCGSSAPPLLWAYGYSSRFQAPGLGIVGSRILTPAEARFASAAGEACAHLGMPVFSGGAAGADSFGAIGAARAGGAAVHFLPGGMPEPFGPVALLTPDPDKPAFDRIDALTRNKWIYASGEATLVVASRFGEGGSWAGAIASMKARLGRIFVYMGPQPSSGNVALAKLGAQPIRSIEELSNALGHSLQPKLAV